MLLLQDRLGLGWAKKAIITRLTGLGVGPAFRLGCALMDLVGYADLGPGSTRAAWLGFRGNLLGTPVRFRFRLASLREGLGRARQR